MVVYLILSVRLLAQVSTLAIFNACHGYICVTTTRYRQVSELAFYIKKRTPDFVIGMRKPALINPPARLIAYCRAGLDCKHVLINLY